MADREKVIRGLQAIYDEAYDRWVHTQYETDRLVTLVAKFVPNALVLLKEQEPIEPIVERINELDSLFRCRGCGAYVLFRKQRYCHACGREVKWDG